MVNQIEQTTILELIIQKLNLKQRLLRQILKIVLNLKLDELLKLQLVDVGKFQKMIIIEINSSNKHLLGDFPQGHNSNGKERKVKFKLNKKLLQNDNFVIYREQEKNENF